MQFINPAIVYPKKRNPNSISAFMYSFLVEFIQAISCLSILTNLSKKLHKDTDFAFSFPKRCQRNKY